jgi:hypothetical protein
MRIPFNKTETKERVDPAHYECPDAVVSTLKQLDRAYSYETQLRGTRVKITFHECRARNCDALAQVAGHIFSLLLPHRKCPASQVQATVMLCDCPKEMPQGKIFGQDHVNTGYAGRCSPKPLVVYREEEWVKVFIHECFHYFNLDSGLSEVRLPMFQLKTPVALYESFCEVWARIINCYITAEHTGKPVETLIEEERQYAVRNMVKVLDHMGLKFQDLTTPRAAVYAEETNVFAYIVLGAILLNDPAEFIEECKGFKGTNAGLLKMVQKQMGSSLFLTELNRQETALSRASKTNRMRMSTVDLFYLLNV